MDGEKSFMTGDLVNFYNTYHIEPYVTATGRSEMNGIVERFHSTILEIYRITKHEHPEKSATDLLFLSLNKYNSTIHSTTKYTPNEIILPSPRTPEIIEKVFKNITEKQKKDLEFHNKSKTHVAIDCNQEVYENARQRMKHKQRFKKNKVKEVNKSTVVMDDGRRVHKDDLKIRKI